MQSLLVSHTQRYHKHHRSGGHVWQGRFKSPVIQNDEHLLTVLRYIEANPLRAQDGPSGGGVSVEQLPRSRHWASRPARRPAERVRAAIALRGRSAA